MSGKTFGEKLCEIRKRNHITQRQLAYFIGVSDKVVSKWERGISLPKADMINNISKFFSVPSDLLLTGEITTGEFSLSDGSPAQGELNGPAKKRETTPYFPDRRGMNGDYMCTWAIQKTVAEKHHITGKLCSEKRDALTSEFLFGEDSLYHPVTREYRKDLIFMIDDGWDVPFGTENSEENAGLFGSLIPDGEKFPSFGSTPAERLAGIAKCAEKWGYGGTGLWISVQKASSPADEDTAEKSRLYWRERVKWCEEAGIKYWKVDWGRHGEDAAYREMITEEAGKYAPNLRIEHCVPLNPFSSRNPKITPTSRKNKIKTLSVSHYFRLYDALDPFYNCVILRRFHDTEICYRENGLKNNCILNVESRPIIAAVLGGTYGIMQYTPETEAVIKWQRISPPFGLGTAKYRFSESTLTDSYYFANDVRDWLKSADELVEETPCPAVMSRGCELPTVTRCGGYLPYVIASRNPVSGAYSVAALRRTVDPHFNEPFLADITLKLKDMSSPIGVFGVMNSLTLRTENLKEDFRLTAQNLFTDEVADITEKIVRCGDKVIIDGKTLRFCGRTNSMNDDRLYGPALFLRFI